MKIAKFLAVVAAVGLVPTALLAMLLTFSNSYVGGLSQKGGTSKQEWEQLERDLHRSGLPESRIRAP